VREKSAAGKKRRWETGKVAGSYQNEKKKIKLKEENARKGRGGEGWAYAWKRRSKGEFDGLRGQRGRDRRGNIITKRKLMGQKAEEETRGSEEQGRIPTLGKGRGKGP